MKKSIDHTILRTVVLIILITSCIKNEPNNSVIKDSDGNVYGSVKIGSQTWLNKDLRTTKYNNGDLIANISDSSGWRLTTTGAYCWYKNDAHFIPDSQGALYNFYVIADKRDVCPAGWHVPSVGEWSTLINSSGGDSAAGGRLKETGTKHWAAPNKNARNEFGFSALPGGFRSPQGQDGYIGFVVNWWSSSEADPLKAWSIYIGFNDGQAGTASSLKRNGFSIRCIKDL